MALLLPRLEKSLKSIEGELVSIGDADVMDIDESLFREGVVKAKAYGEMRVPVELTYVQRLSRAAKNQMS